MVRKERALVGEPGDLSFLFSLRDLLCGPSSQICFERAIIDGCGAERLAEALFEKVEIRTI